MEGGGTTTASVYLAGTNVARSPSPRRFGSRSPDSSSMSETPAASSRPRMRRPCGRSAAERVTTGGRDAVLPAQAARRRTTSRCAISAQTACCRSIRSPSEGSAAGSATASGTGRSGPGVGGIGGGGSAGPQRGHGVQGLVVPSPRSAALLVVHDQLTACAGSAPGRGRGPGRGRRRRAAPCSTRRCGRRAASAAGGGRAAARSAVSSQPGRAHPPSRISRARRCARVAYRRARPCASTCAALGDDRGHGRVAGQSPGLRRGERRAALQRRAAGGLVVGEHGGVHHDDHLTPRRVAGPAVGRPRPLRPAG